jgi:hypothetical protein
MNDVVKAFLIGMGLGSFALWLYFCRAGLIRTRSEYYFAHPHEGACCSSCHIPPDLACREYLEGSNGRCVFCDHEDKCHPGPGATCEIGRGERGE